MSYDKNHAKFLLDNMKCMIDMCCEKDATHFLGLSGGKDSSACVALAEYANVNYRLFVCDTDHEKALTYQYLSDFEKTISAPIAYLKRVTTEAEFEEKRNSIITKWSEWYTPPLRSKVKKTLAVKEMIPPMSQEQIQTALSVMRRSDNEFRNRIIIHGTMPKKTGKFCSLEMKTELAYDHINEYLEGDHTGEDVIWWSGVRSQESAKREGLAVFEKCGMDNTEYVFNFRPIYDLKHEETFLILKYMGLPWNPLYELGDKRVGCGECFEANKAAIRNTYSRDPESLSTIINLEREVALVNRMAVFEGKSHIPFFQESYRLARYNKWATAEQVFEWSKTKRGSEEVDDTFQIRSCDSIYGLCS